MTSITLPSGTYNLIPLPAYGQIQGELNMTDSVAVVASPYVPGQAQTQTWPGADAWSLSMTPPTLLDAQAADWEGFLAELRGMMNVFQWSDPRRQSPLGSALGSPEVAASNVANSTQILTQGWTASTANLLKRGDMFQIGYRLYRVCESVTSDGSGDATIQIWPTLREVPATSTALTLAAPAGLFRLASNSRGASFSAQRFTQISIKATEVR